MQQTSSVSDQSISELTRKSRLLFEDLKDVNPLGANSSSRRIYFRNYVPHPLYFVRAEGPYSWDVDGNRYVDCLMNMGATATLGHKNPTIWAAVMKQLETGLTVEPSDLTVKTSKKLSAMVPNAEIVTFTSTSTEAVMRAIQISRAHTAKQRIVKTEGAFHGWYDYVSVSYKNGTYASEAGPDGDPRGVQDRYGIRADAANDTLVVPFNDADALERKLKLHHHEVAAFILEPIFTNSGWVMPQPEYLKQVKEITVKYNVVLIFDETISGFRVAPGGAQEFCGVGSDIVIFGKALGCGFPISCVAGRREIMKVIDPQLQLLEIAGTHSGNQIPLAAAQAALEMYESGEIQSYLNSAGSKFAKTLMELAHDKGIEMWAQGLGGNIAWYFSQSEPRNYRECSRKRGQKDALFDREMFRRKIMCMVEGNISNAHREEQLREMGAAAEDSLSVVKRAVY